MQPQTSPRIAVPMATPRGTPAGYIQPPTRAMRRRRHAVACIDPCGTFKGLTELDNLFGGMQAEYRSIIKLIDPMIDRTQKASR